MTITLTWGPWDMRPIKQTWMADDGEIESNLPRETVEEQIRTSENIRKLPGVINLGMMVLD